MEIVLIVAVADNGVIGAKGAIPWRLKSDMQRFKAMTMGKPVVMGRKTFVSLRRPLPGRTNIVVTRDRHFRAGGAVVANALADARAVALGDALRRSVTEIAVILGPEGPAEESVDGVEESGRWPVGLGSERAVGLRPATGRAEAARS